MRRLSAKIKRPVTFALVQVDADPDLWRDLMDMTTAAVDEGADLWPQVAGRATGLLSGHFTTYCIFDVVPAYQELKARRLTPDRSDRRALRTAEVRRAILEWQPDEESAIRIAAACDRTYVLGDPPQYEPGPEHSLSALAVGDRAHAHSRSRTTRFWPTTEPGCCTCRSSTMPTGASSRRARCSCIPVQPTASATAGRIAASSVTHRSRPSCSRTGLVIANGASCSRWS